MSNELVDAFEVTRLRLDKRRGPVDSCSSWREAHVLHTVKRGMLREMLNPGEYAAMIARSTLLSCDVLAELVPDVVLSLVPRVLCLPLLLALTSSAKPLAWVRSLVSSPFTTSVLVGASDYLRLREVAGYNTDLERRLVVEGGVGSREVYLGLGQSR